MVLEERLNYLNITIMKANVQLDKISGLKTAKHSCLHHCSLALEVGKKDIRACMDLGEQGEWKEHL